MLTKVKLALRISNTAFDDEIQDLIDGAIADLRLGGVVNIIETDPLIIRAVVTYCKAHFGWDNKDSDKLQQAYEMIKQHLTLSGEYGFYVVTFVVTDGTGNLEDALISFNNEQKYTDSLGNVIFKGIKEAQNQEYSVTLDGYQEINGNIDVTSNTTVNVTMAVV